MTVIVHIKCPARGWSIDHEVSGYARSQKALAEEVRGKILERDPAARVVVTKKHNVVIEVEPA